MKYIFFGLAILGFVSLAEAQTGGQYDLSHSVIAGGGGSTSTGGTFSVSGTAGQQAAGTTSTGATFDVRGGFWFQNRAPTSAAVSITGRVLTANGQGIRNMHLTLTAPDGSLRRAATSTFGYYAFDGVDVGQTYILQIAARKFVFIDSIRVFSLYDHVTGMDFVAEPQ